MSIPPKYEDLVLKVAEMDRRETALREDLARYKSLFAQAQKAIDRLNELHHKRMCEIAKRLTVAEQLLREVLESGDWFRSALEFINGEGLEVRAKIEAALKTVSEKAKSCPNCKVCMGSPDFPENCLINGIKP